MSGESPDDVALDVQLRLEQDPVQALRVAVILLHAAGVHPRIKDNARLGVRNAEAAAHYALKALRAE